jgi:ABC-2 type transport system permease protein
MNAFAAHLALSLRLHLRNRIALIYGYLFPLIYLAAFAVLYRHEKVPLLRHMGELLTVSVLGGACFGLPTTLVSERERGVWRRYRLAPVPTWPLVLGTVLARYAILLSAGALQLAVAFAAGMTSPAHPLALWLAFSAVAFAFIGLGLVIATLADTVVAVQALGQCIFLPMLVIGGVAVPLASLPNFAQHVSAFFPGRYAVEALQSCVTGHGLAGARFSLAALLAIGAGGCFAGTKLFRWDAQQRFADRGGKLWLAAVLAVWFVVGYSAEKRGRIAPAAITDIAPAPAVSEPPWKKITAREIAEFNFNLPSDEGVVAPMAPPDEEPPDEWAKGVAIVREKLPAWRPGLDADEVQRVRNLLCVAAVPDAVQHPLERYLPRVVFDHLVATHNKTDLIKILAWIAQHPEDGAVITDLTAVGFDLPFSGDSYIVREREMLYALKFIARLTGRKPE